MWADVALACELDLNKTVGGLGKLDTTVGHRPGRFQWGHGRLQEQSKHRANIARGARARVLSSDATAVPDHADDFCAQLDAFTGLFFVFLFCSSLLCNILTEDRRILAINLAVALILGGVGAMQSRWIGDRRLRLRSMLGSFLPAAFSTVSLVFPFGIK